LSGGPPSSGIQRLRRTLWDAVSLGFLTPEPAAKAETGSRSGSGSRSAVGPPAPPKGQEYNLDHHLADKSALIEQLFKELDSFGLALGADATRRIRKQ
jgi:hypothetical protein